MAVRPPGGDANEPAIRIFLIADVRGYTLFTQQRGDEAAAKLAAKFAGLAREVVEEHGGSVIELRGDEALCVFMSARQAILAATHAQARFLEETVADPTLPLPVGIGLDVGEAVPFEGGYRGGALNLAARLCGQAAAGEVIASQGVILLARKVDGVTTQDRGELHLKNLTEPVHAYRLIAEDDDPAVHFRAFAPAPPPRGAAPVRLVREHRTLAITLAILLVAAIAVPVGLALRLSSTATIEGDALAKVDAGNGQLKGSVALGSRPGDVAADDTSVWVTLPDAGAVDQIDPSTMTIRNTIPVGADPVAVAIGAGSVWVSNAGSGTVSRISPDTGRVVGTIDGLSGPAGLAAGPGGVWVADSYAASVSLIDPVSGTVAATIGVGDHPVDLAIGDGSIWVANSASGTISQVDPQGRTELQQIPVGNGPQAIDTSDGSVWVANALAGTVAQIDAATGTVAQTVTVGSSPTGLTTVAGSTWVSLGTQGSIAKVQGGALGTPVPLGAETAATSAAGDVLWTVVRGSTSAHRGGTLTVQGNSVFDTLDPTWAYLPQSLAVLAMTNDGLVGFERTGGLASASLIPDLATSLRAPTDGGKTYTFTLRQGITYSNGAPVRPEDIRREIERVFAYRDPHGGASPGVQYYKGIVGADTCSPGRACNLTQGIETDDATGTITFRLTAPNPDFPYALALPFAYAVPTDTPDRLGDRAWIPATGPYMVQTYAPGKEIVLVRNQAFRPWTSDRPDGFPDQIDWKFVSGSGEWTRKVLAGDGDLSWFLPAPGDYASLAENHASQFHVTPAPATFYLSMNTQAPPFDNVMVRRALNFAIDRRVIQRIIGPWTAPSCQVVPPDFPGFRPYCPYTRAPGTTWTAPDMKEAQDLVNRSGTKDVPLVVWTTPDWWPPVARYVRGVLAVLGYQATVKTVSSDRYGTALYGKPRLAQIAMTGWTTDYPAESGFLGALATCGAPSNESGFCDPAIDRRIAAATRLQITQPALAHERWASIEHDVMDEPPWVPVVSRSWANLVSPRLGNFQVSSVWGPLIDQMWVQ